MGVLVGSYCCSSYGAANPFSSLGVYPSSSISDHVLCPMDGCEHPPLHWQSLSEDSYIRLLSASTCWHPQYCLGLVVVYGMDPQVGQSLNGRSFISALYFFSVTPSMGILYQLLRRIKVSTRWSPFFLNFTCFVNYILSILTFWAYIHLSLSAYHVCSFVIGLLPHPLQWSLCDKSKSLPTVLRHRVLWKLVSWKFSGVP